MPRYEPGALIVDKYRLESFLGEGGMATVWLARNVMLDVPVALKVMSPALRGEELIERFFVEARVQARLKHRHIVHVTDFGYTQLGDPFIVMERLEGVTLRHFMHNRGRLNATAAVQIMLPVISALCHAHENGVVHRDLKPENIFLDRSDVDLEPKLLDFGIAKVTNSPVKRHVTQDGVLLGSPAYMAPEQAQGLAGVDHRVDVWAACVVLYEAIAGVQAFPGEGYTVLRAIVEDELPALEDTGAGEAALSEILALGLAKDPAQRTQSMHELGNALAQWLCDRGEVEDLTGNRIARSWLVTTPSEGSAVDAAGETQPILHLDIDECEMPIEYRDDVRTEVVSRQRKPLMSRLLMAAGIVLAAIAVPSNANPDFGWRPSTVHRVPDTLQASALDNAVPIALAEHDAPQALPSSHISAAPQAEVFEKHEHRKAQQSADEMSEAAL